MSIQKVNKWLKFRVNFFDDLKIIKLRSIAGGDTYTIIFLKMMLLSVKNDGKIIYDGVFETLAKELAYQLREDETNIRMTLDYALIHGMIETTDEKEYFIPEASDSIGSETDAAERMRRMREKRNNVTPLLRGSYENVTTDIDIDIDIEKELEKEKDSLLNPLSEKKENEREIKINFQEFKKRLADVKFEFSLQEITPHKKICGYSLATRFGIRSTGFIMNLMTFNDVPPHEAKELWEHLYEHRNAVLAAVVIFAAKNAKKDVA